MTNTATKEVKEIIIDATLNATGALFTNDSKDKTEKSPAMTGMLNIDENLSMPVSGFVETPEDKKSYLALSLGGEGATHYYGRLFRVDEPRKDGPHFTGFITVLPCKEGQEYSNEEWEAAPQLRVVGTKQRASSSGKAYIALNVMPYEVFDNELPQF